MKNIWGINIYMFFLFIGINSIDVDNSRNISIYWSILGDIRYAINSFCAMPPSNV